MQRQSSSSSKNGITGGSSGKKPSESQKAKEDCQADPVNGNENSLPSGDLNVEQHCLSDKAQAEDSCLGGEIPEVPDSDKLPRKKRQLLQEVDCNQSSSGKEGQHLSKLFVFVVSCTMFVFGLFVLKLLQL